MSKTLFTLLIMVVTVGLPLFDGGSQPAHAQWTGRGVIDLQAERIPGDVIVKYQESTSAAARADTLSDYAVARVASAESGLQLVRTAKGAEIATIQRMQADPRIEFAEPNYRARVAATPADPRYSDQYDMRIIGMEQAWDTSLGDNSVITAVVDTGIDLAHPDLRSRIVSLTGGSSPGADHVFLTGASSSCAPVSTPDDDGWEVTATPIGSHGTHVAGTIAAESTLSGGPLEGIAGMAPRTRLAPLKVVDCQGQASSFDIDNAIVFAATHGARVINLSLESLGASGFCPLASQLAIDQAYTRGVFVTAAAGNDGGTALSQWAACNHVVGVGATDQHDAVWTFSQHNSSVDISAPGVQIVSTARLRVSGTHGYETRDGTSSATAHVSGCAALLLSVSPSLGPDRVEQALQDTALDLGAAGRDDFYGSGRLNCAAAIATVAPPTSPTTLTATPSPTAGAPSSTPSPSTGVSCASLYGLAATQSAPSEASSPKPSPSAANHPSGRFLESATGHIPRVLASRPLQERLTSSAPRVHASDTAWTTVTCETFEAAGQSPLWTTWDKNALGPGQQITLGGACWAPVPYQARYGLYSAWHAAGCEDGVNPARSFYPNNTFSVLRYGPFSLADAQDGIVSFSIWYQIGSGDQFSVGASTDGDSFGVFSIGGGTSASSSTDEEPPTADGWRNAVLDLKAIPSLGNLMGQPNVWIAWVFSSDAQGVDDGVFIDDVLIQKRIGPTPTATASPSPGQGGTPSPTGTLLATATPTVTPTPSSTPTVTPTTIAPVGGRGLAISSDSGGVRLSWDPGRLQTGYAVLRLTTGAPIVTLPREGPLPGSATAFVDTAAPPGLSCYAVVPLGIDQPSLSDAECALVGSHSPTGAPTGFTLRLNQSARADLTWGAPANTQYDSYLLADFGTSDVQSLPSTATAIAGLQTSGFSCYAIGATRQGALIGYADVLCGLPGLSTLGPP